MSDTNAVQTVLGLSSLNLHLVHSIFFKFNFNIKPDFARVKLSVPNQLPSSNHLPVGACKVVAEVVVGSQLDGFLWSHEDDVDRRPSIHAEVALCCVRLFETVQPLFQT